MKISRIVWLVGALGAGLLLLLLIMGLLAPGNAVTIPNERIDHAILVIQAENLRQEYQALYRSMLSPTLTLTDGSVIELTTNFGYQFQYTTTSRGTRDVVGHFTGRSSANAGVGKSCYPSTKQTIWIPYPVITLEEAPTYGLRIVDGVPMIPVNFDTAFLVHGYMSPQIAVNRLDAFPEVMDRVLIKELTSWKVTVDYMNWAVTLAQKEGKTTRITCKDGTTVTGLPQAMMLFTENPGKFHASFDVVPSLMSFGFMKNKLYLSSNPWLNDIPAFRNSQDAWKWVLENPAKAEKIPHVGDFNKLP